MTCDYCAGRVIWNPVTGRHEHATSGERITNISPGDLISGSHNRKGTRVMPYDINDSNGS